MVSEICEAFGTTPARGGALDQEWELTWQINEYRAAKAGMAIIQSKHPKERAALIEHAGIMDVLVRMDRAQNGRPLWGGNVQAEAVAIAEARAPEPDEDEGD